jgi:nucleotidyltransferase/DNA polymerase involved in DNA repair
MIQTSTSAGIAQNPLLPAVPFRAKDKTNGAYNTIVVTKVLDNSVLAHTTFADGYRKYERLIDINDIELIPEHKCNPDSFNKHCQTCGRYCG